MEKIIQDSTLDLHVTQIGSCVEISQMITPTRRSGYVLVEKDHVPELIESLKKFL